MEGRFVVAALFFAFLAACSKQDIPVNSAKEVLVTQQVKTQSKLFISGWEDIPLWKMETKDNATIFSCVSEISGFNDDSVTVMVFARNLWTGDEAGSEADDKGGKPLMMPFYFLPY